MAETFEERLVVVRERTAAAKASAEAAARDLEARNAAIRWAGEVMPPRGGPGELARAAGMSTEQVRQIRGPR